VIGSLKEEEKIGKNGFEKKQRKSKDLDTRERGDMENPERKKNFSEESAASINQKTQKNRGRKKGDPRSCGCFRLKSGLVGPSGSRLGGERVSGNVTAHGASKL